MKMGSTSDKNESETKIADKYESDSETNRTQKHSQHKELANYEEFRKYADGLKSDDGKLTYFYFEGDKDSSGKSWCSDCVAAEPYIEAAWDKYKNDNSEFIIVYVGDRSIFKDKKNLFRLDKETNITDIPTIIRWKTQHRLVNTQILKSSLLEMIFTEED